MTPETLTIHDYLLIPREQRLAFARDNALLVRALHAQAADDLACLSPLDVSGANGQPQKKEEKEPSL